MGVHGSAWGHAWVGEAQLPNTGKLEAKVGGAWVHGSMGARVHGGLGAQVHGFWVVVEGSMVARSLGGDVRVHGGGTWIGGGSLIGC